MIRLAHMLMTLALLAALGFAGGALWLAQKAAAPGPLAAEKLVYIAPGTPLKAMAQQLKREAVIDDALAFLLAARWQRRSGELRAGEYLVPAGESIAGLIARLQGGKTYARFITIPEGLTVAEIMALLQGEPALSGAPDPPPEGSLLPETYQFSYGDTRQALLARMQKALREHLQALWAARAEGLPLRTPEEAVVLASIVEKETAVAAERPRVAGVFINRLRRHIPLQSDPTVIYAVTEGKERLERALTYRDLRSPSPYNTYIMVDLPPTPIANPGRAALAAVLQPENNDYLYFVADGTGGHTFAKTLKEHERNVRRWRRLQKKPK